MGLATNKTEFIKVGETLDEGQLVYASTNGCVVYRKGEYFVFPLGSKLDQELIAWDATMYPDLLRAAERVREYNKTTAPPPPSSTQQAEAVPAQPTSPVPNPLEPQGEVALMTDMVGPPWVPDEGTALVQPEPVPPPAGTVPETAGNAGDSTQPKAVPSRTNPNPKKPNTPSKKPTVPPGKKNPSQAPKSGDNKPNPAE